MTEAVFLNSLKLLCLILTFDLKLQYKWFVFRMEGWFIAEEPDDNVSLTRLGM